MSFQVFTPTWGTTTWLHHLDCHMTLSSRPRTCPEGLGTAVRCLWADSQNLATIPDPFRAISVILGPTPYLRLQHLPCLNSRHLSCLSSRHLSCLNSRHLSCLNRRHLSCPNWCAPCAGQDFQTPMTNLASHRREEFGQATPRAEFKTDAAS